MSGEYGAEAGESGGGGAGPQAGAIALGADWVSGIATSALAVHESRQNRRFQREMANTAHQREVKDLIAAGLNPILSAGGNGAPVPGGDSVTPQSPPSLTQGRQSISAAQLAEAQLRVSDAQAGNLHADTEAKNLSNHLNQESYETSLLQRRLEYQNMIRDGNLKDVALDTAKLALQKTNKELALLELDRQHSSLGINKAKSESEWYGQYGRYAPPAAGHGVREAVGAMGAVKNWWRDMNNAWRAYYDSASTANSKNGK